MRARREARQSAPRPRLSVIICVYDMPREAARTLVSAISPYQRDVSVDQYEVVVVENGSQRPLTSTQRRALPTNVRVVDMPHPTPSPGPAMNWAAREVADGEILLFAIDGARIFTDRLYATMLEAHALIDDAFVYTLAWHLGHRPQQESVQDGYDADVEDRLIDASGWPDEPDGLFSASTFALSSRGGFFQPIAESNAFSMPRELFTGLGGYDERFVSPGGGLCNLEYFSRCVSRPGARNVCLLSEGTFHQVHGGASTSLPTNPPEYHAEYMAIAGTEYRVPDYETLYYGRVRPRAAHFVSASLQQVHSPAAPPDPEQRGPARAE